MRLLCSLVLVGALIGVPVSARNAATTNAAREQLAPHQQADRAAQAQQPDAPGSGPFPAMMAVDPLLPNHVLYRPRDLDGLGRQKLAILVWGNGGCTQDGASARHHLLEIASHGYLVVAPGRILSGPAAAADAPAPTPMATSGEDMIKGLDWILAENKRPESRYFGTIDPKAIAFSGHSCGGILAIQMSADRRVRTLIIHNSGVFPNHPQRPQLVTNKAWLQERLRSPVLYVIGNTSDVGHAVAIDDFSRIDHAPVFLAEADVGHGGTLREAGGGAGAQVALAWLQWRLRGDKRAAADFTGADCGLCRNAAWKIRRKKIN